MFWHTDDPSRPTTLEDATFGHELTETEMAMFLEAGVRLLEVSYALCYTRCAFQGEIFGRPVGWSTRVGLLGLGLNSLR